MRTSEAGGSEARLERILAEQLLLARRRQGWSLRKLAEASGLSVTTVHQIETGRTSPNLGTLQSLATALGIPVGALLAPPTSAQATVRVGAQDRRRVSIPEGQLEWLASGLEGQRLRSLVLVLDPGGESARRPIVHPGQELVFGLDGDCVYEVDAVRHSIAAGDSLLFDSSQPHRALNPGSQPAQVLLVFYVPEEVPPWVEMHGNR
jgi:transcriptional regulator with XRE-family HTH domain